jgi:hypothetical protein
MGLSLVIGEAARVGALTNVVTPPLGVPLASPHEPWLCGDGAGSAVPTRDSLGLRRQGRGVLIERQGQRDLKTPPFPTLVQGTRGAAGKRPGRS